MFTPAEIYDNYTKVAKVKTSLVWYKMLILAALAGLFIAFGAATATIASSGLSGSAAALVKGAVFPVGLILVVICGAELFTGNSLLIAPVIGGEVKLKGMLKNWGIVYAGNLIGGVLLAVIVVYSRVMNDAAVDACVAIAAGKCNMNFGYMLLRGIPCNMLVCLAVWAAMASKSAAGKILALYLPIFAFVVCGFEHSVANMYYLSAGLMAGSAPGLNIGNSLLCLLASTIGNIIGGGLIAIAYHAVYRKKKSETSAGSSETTPATENSES